jgi:hypothetical protein
MIYKFREHHSAPIPAQVVGERLAKLDGEGRLSATEVVDDARPKKAPLHPCFEWDDATAAELHREDQARRLIRSVVIVPAEEDAEGEEDEAPASPQIAFVSVGVTVKGGGAYTSTARALSDDELRERVLSDALADIKGAVARHGHLKELAGIMAAIEEVEHSLV